MVLRYREDQCECAPHFKCPACKQYEILNAELFRAAVLLTTSIEQACPYCGELFILTKGQVGCAKKGQLVFCGYECCKRSNDKRCKENRKTLKNLYK
jgi:hypothetical protein